MYVEKRRSYEKFVRLTLVKLTTGHIINIRLFFHSIVQHGKWGFGSGPNFLIGEDFLAPKETNICCYCFTLEEKKNN